jgi:hypothetical protein
LCRPRYARRAQAGPENGNDPNGITGHRPGHRSQIATAPGA